jgi:hypothetical protein
VHTPELLERSARAQRHVPFVAWRRARIERDGRVPERPQHLHTVAVIPHRCDDDTAGARDSNHLLHRGGRIRDEVQHEHRQCPVEGVVGERQRERVADLEPAVQTQCTAYSVPAPLPISSFGHRCRTHIAAPLTAGSKPARTTHALRLMGHT